STSSPAEPSQPGATLLAGAELRDWGAWEADGGPDMAALFEAGAMLTSDAEAEEWNEQAASEAPQLLFDLDEGGLDAPRAPPPPPPPTPATSPSPPAATPEQLAFMRAVYEEHFRNSFASWKRGSGRAYVSDLPRDRLDVVEGRIDNPKRPVWAERETARQ